MHKKNKKQDDPDRELRKIAAQKVDFRISVNINIFAFMIYNLALYILNIITLPHYLWVIYPFFGWLIGLNIHIANYIMFSRGIDKVVKISVVNHTIAYFSVMLFFFFTSLYNYGIVIWYVIPFTFWGFGLICHYIVFFNLSGKALSRRKNAIEREMQKMVVN
jgi:hypothetical protein